jgi:hypothetical protein
MSGILTVEAKNLATDRGLSARPFAALLGVLVAATCSDVLLGWSTFFFRDFGFFGYPLAIYHRTCFWRGEWPLWNPLNNLGIPFLAQWNTMTLYPGSLFYLLFPLPWSLSVFCLLHQYWGGIGMYFLARRWTGNTWAAAWAGLIFAFNGLMLNCLMWPNNIAALGWMPWVILCVEQAWTAGGRQLIRAGLIGALQMLTGAPEFILLTWGMVAIVAAAHMVRSPKGNRHRLLLRLGFAALLVAALAAVQLLPFVDLLIHSQRHPGFAGSDWSLPIWGWANFLVPDFRCFYRFFNVPAQYSQYWTSSYYFGIGAVALAAFALIKPLDYRARMLGVVALISIWLAMGDAALLFKWLRQGIPVLGFMRYPIKFVTCLAFVIPLLAAFGLTWWWGRHSPAPGKNRRLLWGIGAGLCGLIAVILWWNYRYPPSHGDPVRTQINGVSRAVLLGSMLAGVVWLGGSPKRPNLFWLKIGWLCLTFLDFLTHLPQQNPTIPIDALAPGIVQLSPAPRHGQSRAMVTPAAALDMHGYATRDPFIDFICCRLGLFVNLNLVDGIPKVDGLYSLYLREADRIRVHLYAQPELSPSLMPLCDFLGVSYITVPGKPFEWQPRTGFLPMLTIGQRPVFADDLTSLSAITQGGFDPRQTVFLPLEARSACTVTGTVSARILSSRFASQQMDAELSSPQTTLLVIAQAYYHCWKAYVDGIPTPIYRANHAFQALEIPAGHHQVSLVYEDKSFRWGALISALTAAVGLALYGRTKDGWQNPARAHGESK